MAVDMRDYLARLPVEERHAVEARASELIAEEATPAIFAKSGTARRSRSRSDWAFSKPPYQNWSAAPTCT